MRNTIFIAALLAAGTADRLSAQTDYYVRVGATGWTTLVHDFIAQNVDTRVSLGPVVALGVGHPIAPKYGAGLELALGSNALRTEYGSTSSAPASARTAGLTALLDGAISSHLQWRAGLGFLHYFASGDAGVLSESTTRLLVAGGLDYRRHLLPSWDLMISGRYDFHKFTSPELKAHGFSQAQGVQRVSLTLGVARRHR